MQHSTRNLVLLGREDSGKSVLTELIVGGGGGGGGDRRNTPYREVDVSLTEPHTRLRLFELAPIDAIDRDTVLDIVKQTTETCFVVVVVDINKSVEFMNELVSLKGLSDYLSDYSYSLFGNCILVFTHTDELSSEINRDRMVQQEFEEILSLVAQKHIFLNCTDRSGNNRDRVLEGIVRLSRPTLRIVCYGNNAFKNESFLPGLFEISENVYLCRAPDLDLFHQFEHVTSPELLSVVGDAEHIGKGVSVFIVLISLSEIFSQSMVDLIKRIPSFLGLEARNEKYFWKRALIVFDAEGRDNPDRAIQESIHGNSGIRNIIETAGNRYTYVTLSMDESLPRLLTKCHEIKQANNHTEFIGGRDVNARALRTNVTLRQARNGRWSWVINFIQSIRNKLFQHRKKLFFGVGFCAVAGVGLCRYREYNFNRTLHQISSICFVLGRYSYKIPPASN